MEFEIARAREYYTRAGALVGYLDPAGKPILLILRSRDVIHNFFVRELRLKQDTVPGMEIPFPFTADTPGIYEVACSELCGLGHHQMRTTLEVLPEADFEKWKREQASQK